MSTDYDAKLKEALKKKYEKEVFDRWKTARANLLVAEQAYWSAEKEILEVFVSYVPGFANWCQVERLNREFHKQWSRKSPVFALQSKGIWPREGPKSEDR